jgi:DUF971 family protein
MLTPTNLVKTPDRKLLITWSDEVQHEVSFRKLRDSCRCAHCIDKRMKEQGIDPGNGSDEQEATEAAAPEPPKSLSLPILTAAEARPLDISQMHPVGNYAYNIHFSDGHSAGIFTFEMLRELGTRE